MEYDKIKKLLNNTSIQTYKCRTKNWVQNNDNVHQTYNTNSQIQNTMLKSSLCDHNDA